MPGSTPTVETVMCRAPMPKPCASLRIVRTLSTRRPVQQRLAHAHENDVRRVKRRVEQRELAHLARDLVRLEVAREPHQARRAERAPERAACLRRHAERQSIALRESPRSRCAVRRAGGTGTSRCRPPTSVATRSRDAGCRTVRRVRYETTSVARSSPSKLATGECHRCRTTWPPRNARSPRATAKSRTADNAAAGSRFRRLIVTEIRHSARTDTSGRTRQRCLLETTQRCSAHSAGRGRGATWCRCCRTRRCARYRRDRSTVSIALMMKT